VLATSQIFMHARGDYSILTGSVDLFHAAQQSLIIESPGTCWALLPGVKITGRGLETSTHQAERKLFSTTFNSLMLQVDSLE
jgi:hypothetical protein